MMSGSTSISRNWYWTLSDLAMFTLLLGMFPMIFFMCFRLSFATFTYVPRIKTVFLGLCHRLVPSFFTSIGTNSLLMKKTLTCLLRAVVPQMSWSFQISYSSARCKIVIYIFDIIWQSDVLDVYSFIFSVQLKSSFSSGFSSFIVVEH